MKKKSLPVLLMLVPVFFPGNSGYAQGLDPRYHTFPEILALLDSLAAVPAYQTILRVDTIGISQQDLLPIPAVKISDNVNIREDEPRVLFVGQVHAEEILGVEAVLKLMATLLNPPPALYQQVTVLRQELEIWIVPSANPEGLTVVHEGLDLSYRKNKHDFDPAGPWPNGIFDYDPGIGNDVDGVDLNRNFDFNWFLGDGFLEPDPTPYGADYDYYRGPEPFSEAETRALRDLALGRNFLFSIIWHSSRSGNLSEKVFYPWQWGDKTTPDDESIRTIGESLAGLIVNESGSGTYLPAYGTGRNGHAHDWFYAATGCFQYLVECGTANLQPDSALIENTINRLQPAMFYLMDRSIGYGGASAAQISGIVRDPSGTALEGAQVTIRERTGSVQTPRRTDEFGRFRRIVSQGTYHLTVRKAGYISQILVVTANTSSSTNLVVTLVPRPIHDITLLITSETGQFDHPINAVFSTGLATDSLVLVPGTNVIPRFDGVWEVRVFCPGYLPWIDSLVVEAGLTRTVFMAVPALSWNPVPGDASTWDSIAGAWQLAGDTLRSQESRLYTNADGDSVYRLQSGLLDATGCNRLVLGITHRYEVEWDHDTVAMYIQDESGNVLGARRFMWQNWEGLTTDWLGIQAPDGFTGIRVGLELGRDASVNYRGWEITGLVLQGGYDLWMSTIPDPGTVTEDLTGSISAAYPNPTSGPIHLDLRSFAGPVEVTVYNLLGQQVLNRRLDPLPREFFTLQLDLREPGLKPLGTGLYFLHLKTPERSTIRKCVFLKN